MERLTAATEPGAISLATGHPAPRRFRCTISRAPFTARCSTTRRTLMQYRSSTGDPRAVRASRRAAARARMRRRLRRRHRLLRRATGRGHRRDRPARRAQRRGQREPDVLGKPRRLRRARRDLRRGARRRATACAPTTSNAYLPSTARACFYINPIAQNPTGAVLPARRAKQIVALARRYDVVVLEDQTGWQLTYDAPAPPPLAAFDTDGRVIVMESLSKSIFPALRIGYLYAKGGIAEALEAAKVRADVFTSTLTQRALWRFMESPACPRHFRSTRALYRKRRDAFVESLSAVVSWTTVRSPGAGVERVALVAAAHLDARRVRRVRARGRARNAGRAVLSHAQRAAGAALVVRPPDDRRGAGRRGAPRPRPRQVGSLAASARSSTRARG